MMIDDSIFRKRTSIESSKDDEPATKITRPTNNLLKQVLSFNEYYII